MLHVEKESGAEISPFQPNMVAMSVLKNSLNPATSNPALVSCKLIFLLLKGHDKEFLLPCQGLQIKLFNG
jgi:hypothetical protein